MTMPVAQAATPPVQPAAPPEERSAVEVFPSDYGFEYVLAVMKKIGVAEFQIAMAKPKLKETIKAMASQDGCYICRMHGASRQYMQNSASQGNAMVVPVGVKKIVGSAAPVDPLKPAQTLGI